MKKNLLLLLSAFFLLTAYSCSSDDDGFSLTSNSLRGTHWSGTITTEDGTFPISITFYEDTMTQGATTINGHTTFFTYSASHNGIINFSQSYGDGISVNGGWRLVKVKGNTMTLEEVPDKDEKNPFIRKMTITRA